MQYGLSVNVKLNLLYYYLYEFLYIIFFIRLPWHYYAIPNFTYIHCACVFDGVIVIVFGGLWVGEVLFIVGLG